jgi:hypothetical protein
MKKAVIKGGKLISNEALEEARGSQLSSRLAMLT